MSFKGTGLVVAFLPVYALRQGTRRYMAEKFILTHAHTHTHEMSYEMLQQQVQERLTQKSCNRLMNFCTGSIPWSKKSCQSQCSCKHPSTDDDGNSSVWSFGKVGENWKKTWRKYRENMWNILVLPSFFCSGLKLYKRFRWNVIYS